MSSMLEQAIIDAKELKEAAQQNAQEAVIEKYQSEIKEAVDSILEQEDPMAALPVPPDPSLGAEIGAEVPVDEEDAPPEGQIDSLLEQLPFLQTTSEDDYIDLDLRHLEESLNIISDEMLLKELNLELSESMFFEEDEDPFGLEEDTLEEDLFDEEIELEEDIYDGELEEVELDEEYELEEDYDYALEEINLEEDYIDEDLDIFEEEIELEEVASDDETPAYGAGAPTRIFPLPTPWSSGYVAEQKGKHTTNEALLKKLLTEEEQKIRTQVPPTSPPGTYLKERKSLSNKVQLLESKLGKYGTIINKLKNKLNESSLQNAKLLYQNRVLDSISLNERQKDKIVEAIHNTNSVEEAKIIFETLQSTVGSVKSKPRKAPESLNEVVTRSSSAFISRKEEKREDNNPFAERMKTLAGLK